MAQQNGRGRIERLFLIGTERFFVEASFHHPLATVAQLASHFHAIPNPRRRLRRDGVPRDVSLVNAAGLGRILAVAGGGGHGPQDATISRLYIAGLAQHGWVAGMKTHAAAGHRMFFICQDSTGRVEGNVWHVGRCLDRTHQQWLQAGGSPLPINAAAGDVVVPLAVFDA